MLTKIFLLNLLCLIEFVYSFKLNNTFNHKSQVNVICELKINFESYSTFYLASGSVDASMKIWDVTNGKLIYTFEESNGGHSSAVWSLAPLENGYLASGSGDGTVKIWDIKNGRLKYTFDQSNGSHTSWVESLVSLENGYLASGSIDHTIKI
jgi:WD40 repeat protein